nr:centrosomal protein of 72 kDa-like isoform X2 [Lytechinus pictus]
MTLTITEAWIRDRVQLTHDNLEDVRSLSLPGTYQEKIGGLGNALSSFIRLKHIDLSRNALQSLQGLHHLKALEKLNLYYNNISSIQELKRLRHNTSLQEIDLRLNPVTKNEPDYRLYLVHMLPNLRKLDDRSVRESERKTALLHFDTDQAMSMTEHTVPQGLEPLRGELPRTKHVRGLGGRTAIEEDDSDLLDLLSRTNGDLSRPRPVTGSNVTNPSVDVQLTQDYQRGYSQRTPPRRKAESSPSSRGVERDRSLYQTEPSQHLSDRERSQQQQQRSRVEVGYPEQEVRGRVDSNLKFTDESDAYAAYSSKVNFTPNPKAGTRTDSSSSYDLHPVSGVGETFDDPPPVQRNIKQNGTTSAPAMSPSTFLDSLLNLVDRYWNGTKSLHAHSKFQGQALPLVEKLLADHSATSQEHMDRLQLDVARYAQENVSLRNKLGSTVGAKTQQDTPMAGSELQRVLDKSQRDVDRLCLELREVSDENRELQVQLQDARRQTDDGPSHRDVKGQEKLEQENEKLKVQLKHVSQLQELATMLQESHKSLVTTNDHLLKELEETKQRHMEEVKQLHWSYNQLKQTMDITMPSSHAPPQSTTTTTQGGAVNGYDKKEEGSLSMQPGYGSYSPGKKVKGFSYSNGSMYD